MPGPGKISLMIVEDEANLRLLLDAAAQRSGLFEPIASFDDGQAAFERLQTWGPGDLPALVVTDLSMPRMSGIELVRAMKTNPRLMGIPIAIITSSDAPNDRQRALAAGVCAFVHKPFGVDALMRALIEIRDRCVEQARAENVV